MEWLCLIIGDDYIFFSLYLQSKIILRVSKLIMLFRNKNISYKFQFIKWGSFKKYLDQQLFQCEIKYRIMLITI